jgi:outer membrane immunogenic protein
VTRLQLLGAAVIVLVVRAASAADLSHLPDYKAPLTPPVYNWSGLYVRGNGLGWGNASDVGINGLPLGSDSNAFSSIIGGVQAGYNLQNGNWVFGLETDMQGSGSQASALGCGGAPCSALAQTYDRWPWFGTVRGRIGFTPANGWLLYTTGGLAYGELNDHGTASAFTAAGTAPTSAPYAFFDTKLGWTLGVGVEAALAGDWTWKLEYLYLKPEDASQTAAVSGLTFTANGHAYDNLLRAGLNYRFGWDGPVIGK